MGLVLSLATRPISCVSDVPGVRLDQLVAEVESPPDTCTLETVVNWAPYKVWKLWAPQDSDPVPTIQYNFNEPANYESNKEIFNNYDEHSAGGLTSTQMHAYLAEMWCYLLCVEQTTLTEAHLADITRQVTQIYEMCGKDESVDTINYDEFMEVFGNFMEWVKWCVEESVIKQVNNLELLKSAQAGNLTVVKTLLSVQKGNIDVDHRSPTGDTALIIACFENHAQIVDMLLDAGANADIYANDGTHPLSVAAELYAVDEMERLLSKGANVNYQTQFGTALMYASKSGKIGNVEYLLKRGADPEIKNKDGNTAINFTTSPEIQALLQQAIEAKKAPAAAPATAKPAATAKAPAKPFAALKKAPSSANFNANPATATPAAAAATSAPSPATGVAKPAAPSSKPQPGAAGTKPAAAVTKPAAVGTKPAAVGAKPAAAGVAPVATGKPAAGSPKPAAGAPVKPAAGAPLAGKPAAAGAPAAAGTPPPAGTKPAAGTLKPAGLKPAGAKPAGSPGPVRPIAQADPQPAPAQPAQPTPGKLKSPFMKPAAAEPPPAVAPRPKPAAPKVAAKPAATAEETATPTPGAPAPADTAKPRAPTLKKMPPGMSSKPLLKAPGKWAPGDPMPVPAGPPRQASKANLLAPDSPSLPVTTPNLTTSAATNKNSTTPVAKPAMPLPSQVPAPLEVDAPLPVPAPLRLSVLSAIPAPLLDVDPSALPAPLRLSTLAAIPPPAFTPTAEPPPPIAATPVAAAPKTQPQKTQPQKTPTQQPVMRKSRPPSQFIKPPQPSITKQTTSEAQVTRIDDQPAQLAVLQDLQKRIHGLPIALPEPGRRFVKEGEVQKVSHNKTQTRYLFLFNDVLIYTKVAKKNVSYDYRGHVLLDALLINNLPLGKSGKYEFEIVRLDEKKTKYKFLFKTLDDKRKWVDAIQPLIDIHLQLAKQKGTAPGASPATQLTNKPARSTSTLLQAISGGTAESSVVSGPSRLNDNYVMTTSTVTTNKGELLPLGTVLRIVAWDKYWHWWIVDTLGKVATVNTFQCKVLPTNLPFKAVALSDYTAKSDDELSYSKGDVAEVVNVEHRSGSKWKAAINGAGGNIQLENFDLESWQSSAEEIAPLKAKYAANYDVTGRSEVNQNKYENTKHDGDWAFKTADQPLIYARSLFEYIATTPLEMTIEKDDMVIIKAMQSSDWMRAVKKGGKEGLVPANYFQIYRPLPFKALYYDDNLEAVEVTIVQGGDIMNPETGWLAEDKNLNTTFAIDHAAFEPTEWIEGHELEELEQSYRSQVTIFQPMRTEEEAKTTELFGAVQNGPKEILRALLQDKWDKMTIFVCLAEAVRMQDLEKTYTILAHGAPTCVVDSQGRSLLHYLFENEDTWLQSKQKKLIAYAICVLLLTVNVDPSIRNANGKTAFQLLDPRNVEVLEKAQKNVKTWFDASVMLESTLLQLKMGNFAF